MNNYLLTEEIVFDSKPEAVPYNYRISYKMAQICLIISKSCKGRAGCSLIKLHIISNALNTQEYMNDLQNYVNGKIGYIIVRFDPVVNRAIKYAIADNLIEQLKNGTFKLTENGKKLIKKVEKEDIMAREKKFLDELGSKLSNEKVERLMSLWRYKNAEN
ncbi:hypothetical protein DW918_11070 [Eubacterium ventriosum]|uniref:Uncharacterized protein n=1 Tax=Eubacterium ventriosum TaxID=39496 RepID=A0A413T036_9FIRM|nr:hypothetical protein DW918_11070 [Eubacterium ventriosum]